ncbi:Fc.00g068830.m01.CDS01 [Cosmosporella sp. VM-42]
MNNFGVIELANAKKTSAPGWAYVPDTSINLSSTALKPANRKRARNAPGLSIGDLSARQEVRIRKEVAALDRDGGRDNSIPLPHRGGRPQGKHTPNVRKILQSQKTFANHLDDFRAMQALAESNAATTSRNAATNASKRPLNRRDTPTSARQSIKVEDTEMVDADLPPVLPPYYKPAPDPHPGDNDPLLVSRVPEMPSDEELRKLLEHPPLTYGEAAGTWEQKYPVRVFCEVCGYWGRVRCMKCGTRVCALDCLETHREECVTRYGL